MGGGLVPPPELLQEWTTNREKFPYGERRGPFLVILVSILLALTFAAVAGRLWARCKIRHNAGLDDLLIVAALPFLLGYDICNIMGFYYYGVDRHTWEITFDQGVAVRVVTWAMSLCYLVVTALVKISILQFYRRLGEGAMTTTWLWTIRIATASVITYAVVFIIMAFIACQPMEAFWKKMNPEWMMTHDFQCFNEGADFIATAVVSVTEDAVVCILPLLVVWRLQMPRKQKMALAGIFGVGFFLCLCGILRVVYMYKVYYKTYDSTWEALPVWYWTLVEIHFAIICASAPALNLFFHRALQSTSDDSYPARHRQGYDSFGSRRLESNSTKDDVPISLENMLAYEEANVGADKTAIAFSDARNGAKPPAFITVTRGVDVSFSRNSEVLGSGANSREDGPSKKSIGTKNSSESLLVKSDSNKDSS